VRLVAHVVAAALVVAGIGTWQTLSWPGLAQFDLAWAAVPFTVFVVTGFVNAFNFMDGIDGIAGSQAVIAGIGWVGVGYAIQDPLVAATGAAIAGASLGFLRFNWSPASIFMGDVGSYFLGFLLMALPVYVAQQSPAAATAGMLFVWPFIFDAAFTFVRRAVRREHLLSAHRSHLYQRLVLTGVSHRTMTLVYAGLAAIGVGVGHAVLNGFESLSMAGALLIGGLAVALWLTTVRRERSRQRA
jgi:UDP-N-acetylmuramyl pentapeptide phosphotransferase/UDP-N-acetylglucosamine-1-phosphate transferase